jgi:hypothetical protein
MRNFRYYRQGQRISMNLGGPNDRNSASSRRSFSNLKETGARASKPGRMRKMVARSHKGAEETPASDARHAFSVVKAYHPMAPVQTL